MTSLMQSYFELKSELKCPIHRNKDLDRLILDKTESKTLICSLCEYAMKKEKKDKMSLTVPLEAFLQQLSEIEVSFTNKVKDILKKNQTKRDELLDSCDQLISSFLNFQRELKQQIHEQEENIKANLHKANESTKLIVDKILGKYTTKSTFEGLYSNIVSKLRFDNESGDLESLVEYDNALKQAQVHSSNFVKFSKQISEDIEALFMKFSKYSQQPMNNTSQMSNILQSQISSKISSLNTSLVVNKELNMMDVNQCLQNSKHSSSINMNIDGQNCITSQLISNLNQYILQNSELKECAISLHGGVFELEDLVKLFVNGISSIYDFQLRFNGINIKKEENKLALSQKSLKQSDFSTFKSSQKFDKFETDLKQFQLEKDCPFIDRTNSQEMKEMNFSYFSQQDCKHSAQKLTGSFTNNNNEEKQIYN